MSSRKSFTPESSRMSESSRSKWSSSPITFSLKQVPGIGDVNADLLKACGIESTPQLLAFFLAMRQPKQTPREHLEQFYEYLKETAKLRGNLHTIVDAMRVKFEMYMPELFLESAAMVRLEQIEEEHGWEGEEEE
jgi:hypothetical protein